jgi:bile acid:Na+ symporter, BASS family
MLLPPIWLLAHAWGRSRFFWCGMSLTQLILLAVNLSLFLIVLALGLETAMSDALSLLRQPALLLRSILAMYIVMLALAIALGLLFSPPAPLKIALIALALSPVPPVLPSKQKKAGGTCAYAVGLLVAAALVAIVLMPVTMAILGSVVGRSLQMPINKVALIVVTSVIAPLVVGIVLRWLAPNVAQAAARPVATVATVLLVIAVLPVFVIAWPMVEGLVGNGLVILLAVFTLVGLAAGHLLGGPDPNNRTVLALATGARHPGVAIAIASVNFPDERSVLAVVLYHLIFAAIVSVPYVMWRTRSHAANAKVRV